MNKDYQNKGKNKQGLLNKGKNKQGLSKQRKE